MESDFEISLLANFPQILFYINKRPKVDWKNKMDFCTTDLSSVLIIILTLTNPAFEDELCF